MTPSPSLADLIDRLDRLARALERRLPDRSAVSAPGEGRAFQWEGPDGLRAVSRPAAVAPSLLTGVDRQQQVFYRNVERFVSGGQAHDILLWGERGTGKSSLVRSLLTAFAETPLALVEVPEPRIPDLPRLLDALAGDPRRWVLYLDDLAFQGPGDHYRELKVLLEGGLEARPANTLVVATSNRRHLVPEAFPDGDEIHPDEAVAETVSLADRFGLSLGFYPFDEATYLEAVSRHLAALGVAVPPDGWQAEAARWAMSRGIRSGRTARQAALEIGSRR